MNEIQSWSAWTGSTSAAPNIIGGGQTTVATIQPEYHAKQWEDYRKWYVEQMKDVKNSKPAKVTQEVDFIDI